MMSVSLEKFLEYFKIQEIYGLKIPQNVLFM